MEYLYAPVINGRSVTAIQFTIADAGNALSDDIEQPVAEKLGEADEDSPWAFLPGALGRKNQECEFTSEQLDEILLLSFFSLPRIFPALYVWLMFLKFSYPSLSAMLLL